MISASISASFANTSGGLLEVEKLDAAGAKTVLCSVAAGQSGSISGSLAAGDRVKVAKAGNQPFSISFSGTISNAAVADVSSGGVSLGAATCAQVDAGYSGSFTAVNQTLQLTVA
jgi:hypothetical protein